MQHYYICKMFLSLHRPSSHTVDGFHYEIERRRNEVCILNCTAIVYSDEALQRTATEFLGRIIGLAISNGLGDQGKLTAHHQLNAGEQTSLPIRCYKSSTKWNRWIFAQ